MAEVTLDEYAEELAWVVGNDLKRAAEKDQDYGFDPITIITIIKIIIELVKLWKDANSDKDAAQIAEKFGKMSVLEKWILWRTVKKDFKNRREAKYVYRSMTNLSSNMSLEARIKLFTLKESK